MKLLSEIVVNAAFASIGGSGNTDVGVIPMHMGGGLYADFVSLHLVCTATTVSAGTPVLRSRLLWTAAETTETSLGPYAYADTSVSTQKALLVTLNSYQTLYVPSNAVGSGNASAPLPIFSAFVYLGMSGATTGDATYAVTARLWGR